jgi:hypothetical protein
MRSLLKVEYLLAQALGRDFAVSFLDLDADCLAA